jgi:hypothetical protein
MTEAEAWRIINATVRLNRNGCKGVLVPGGLILTATRCLDGAKKVSWEGHTEKITTKNAFRFKVGLLAADPVSDIAVLGGLCGQEVHKDREKFEQWRDATPAVPLANTPLGCWDHPISAFILSHHNTLVGANIHRYELSGHLGGISCIETDDRVEDWMVGGPVVDSAGRLVGVVSLWGENALYNGKYPGMFPIARLALPQWALAVIDAHQDEAKRQTAGALVL